MGLQVELLPDYTFDLFVILSVVGFLELEKDNRQKNYKIVQGCPRIAFSCFVADHLMTR